MHPKILFAVLLLVAVPAIAAGPLQSAAPGKSGCEQTADLSGLNEFTCALKPSRKAVLYRFRATFSGVHDDTRVMMEQTLNGRLLTCAEGSKTDFTGEEVGTSSVDCRFVVPGDMKTQSVLKVRMRWGHGDLVGIELIRG